MKLNENFFKGICQEPNHSKKLEYFCRTHNILCCSVCVSEIKNYEKGLHSKCNFCKIEEVKDEKKNKLKENIKYLNEINKSISENVAKLNEIYDKIIYTKESLKLKNKR